MAVAQNIAIAVSCAKFWYFHMPKGELFYYNGYSTKLPFFAISLCTTHNQLLISRPIIALTLFLVTLAIPPARLNPSRHFLMFYVLTRISF